MIDQIKKDLLDLGVIMDNFVSESSLYRNGKVQEAIDYLSKFDLLSKDKSESPNLSTKFLPTFFR